MKCTNDAIRKGIKSLSPQELLLELGRRNLSSGGDVKDHYEGFRKAMEREGLDPKTHRFQSNSIEKCLLSETVDLEDDYKKTDKIIVRNRCCCDHKAIAREVLKNAGNKYGIEHLAWLLNVPADCDQLKLEESLCEHVNVVHLELFKDSDHLLGAIVMSTLADEVVFNLNGSVRWNGHTMDLVEGKVFVSSSSIDDGLVIDPGADDLTVKTRRADSRDSGRGLGRSDQKKLEDLGFEYEEMKREQRRLQHIETRLVRREREMVRRDERVKAMAEQLESDQELIKNARTRMIDENKSLEVRMAKVGRLELELERFLRENESLKRNLSLLLEQQRDGDLNDAGSKTNTAGQQQYKFDDDDDEDIDEESYWAHASRNDIDFRQLTSDRSTFQSPMKRTRSPSAGRNAHKESSNRISSSKNIGEQSLERCASPPENERPTRSKNTGNQNSSARLPSSASTVQGSIDSVRYRDESKLADNEHKSASNHRYSQYFSSRKSFQR